MMRNRSIINTSLLFYQNYPITSIFLFTVIFNVVEFNFNANYYSEAIYRDPATYEAYFNLCIMTAIVATLFVCVNYLKVQSDVVQLNKSITALEKQITDLDKENDALEAVLENESYDLETVYQMAVGVLGMVYPNNNEVIYYNNESEGYFRQYQDIPKS